MLKFQIRTAQPTDLNSVYSMVCALENSVLEKQKFENIFYNNLRNNNIHYIIAESSDNVVGFMSVHIQTLLHHSGLVAEIQELFVHEDVRGGGVGRRLVDYAKQIASKNKCEILEVSCNIKREAAHKFYEREGLMKTHYKFTIHI